MSRIFGFVRDSLLAMALGAGMGSDAFFFAFRVPDLFRKLFSDGALGLSFIPVFTEEMALRGVQDAFIVARSVLFWLLIAAAISFFGVWGINELGGGMMFISLPHPEGGILPHAIDLFKVMMPYLITTLWLAICAGILNSFGHFVIPALAPLLFNMVMISAAVLASLLPINPSLTLAWAVTVGGVLQLLMTVPILARKGFSVLGDISFSHPAVVKIFKKGIPAMIGTAGYQLNLFIATLFAASLAEGCVSYLYYADRLIQFPLALFTISLAVPLFPELSKKVVSGDFIGASDLFMQGVRMVLFVITPSMVGLALLRDPIVALLFHQGAFDLADVSHTGEVLLFSSIGLGALSGIRLYVPLYYAQSNMMTPLFAALVAMSLHFFLSMVMVGTTTMGAAGLALSVSVASVVNFLILQYGLSRHGISFSWVVVGQSIKRTLLLSTVMAGVVYILAESLCPVTSFSHKGAMAMGVFVSVASGVLVYIGLACWLKVPEIEMVLQRRGKR